MASKPNARQQIIDTAMKLFCMQGYHATGLNQIIKESSCPKGSLYYYFPEGKEELAVECISTIKEYVLEKWRMKFEQASNPVAAIQAHISDMIQDGKQSQFKGFMPFSFWMAAETCLISERLRSACQIVFIEWQQYIAQQLVNNGANDSSADETSNVILSLMEGALILAITHGDEKPLVNISRLVPSIVHGGSAS
ncbi:transcriptional regulator, TetR family [Paenibacillus algorifonticola]|uniref:Transcriptional regulator, TetR family n=1 Tax=Paenibacillus algorifonticola TaxID=684063 RepID=A0A1I2IGV7_9BACL|nr:TetR/AcrR family transcriptional regulator [Paenibacillus algorifonticola]SFF40868.1 transcriptional regulator, TetR family [Paenibacillus algorifonticola]